MSERHAGSVVVVGGGASGVILAAHLLQTPDPSLRVTVIEKRRALGQGMAYSTTLPDHLLNVNASKMGALADDPEHFWRWLKQEGLATDEDGPVYAPRSTYAAYLEGLLSELVDRERRSGRFRLIHEEGTTITPTAAGVEVRLMNGTSVVGHRAVLAVGHDEAPDQPFAVRIGSAADTPIDPSGRVLILGTGLSMVDAWLTLEHRGHRGEILAVSRRGLLPCVHRTGTPLRLDSADIPLGTDLRYFVDWLRDLVRATERSGGDWRDVVDGLWPFNQRIWQDWPISAKRRFLVHIKAWWDIHRHRVAPQIHERVTQAVRSGRLRPLAARVIGIEGADGDYTVTLQPRKTPAPERYGAVRIFDCTGVIKDVSAGSIAVIRSLIDRGLARPDALRLGLDVTSDCAVIDAAGAPSDRLFAVGPLTRGTFFEIDAIPDIRAQCASLANRLVS